MSEYSWSFKKEKCDNLTVLWMDGEPYFYGYSQASTKDGRSIDTRTADLISFDITSAVYQAENGLVLKQILSAGQMPSVQIELSDKDGEEVETNNLMAMNIMGGEGSFAPVVNCLFTRMLLVPYDNRCRLGKYRSG